MVYSYSAAIIRAISLIYGIACAVAHGVQWFDDPLLKRLKSVFVTTKTLGDLRHGLKAFYAGFR